MFSIMNLKNFKYRSLLLGCAVAGMLSTSCKDFLEADVYDQYSTESMKSYNNCLSMTKALYGGKLWFQYDSKFNWCVNEGLAGVCFNVFQEEGALFLLSIGEDNPILKEGYTSIYSGVISHCNQIIELVSSLETSSSFSETQKNQILAEARLFRGYAHFLATEYFGEAPLVLHTGNDISQNKTVARVSRRTLYAAIEQDLQFAVDNLPVKPSDNWRASKYSAEAMLAKFYLTKGSCVKPLPGGKYPFTVTEAESKELMNKVITLCTDVINNCGGEAALIPHSEIFSADNRLNPVSESVFALYYPDGEYGDGSAYQSQIALNSTWSPGSGWGGGKGITYTLYNSYDNSDERKYELCFCINRKYTTVNNVVTYYGSDYKSYTSPDADLKTGSEFLSSGQCLLNNIKKYVWGVDGTAGNASGMSVGRRQDVIRLSDVYFMRAEAKMASKDLNVLTPLADGVDDINTVLRHHNAPALASAEIAFFEDLRNNAKNSYSFTVPVGEGQTANYTITTDSLLYHKTIRTDLVQQRRKEFAMEGQSWLDLKRLFYRDPEMGKQFMYQMDRAAQFSKSPEVESESSYESETGFERRALVYLLNEQLKKDYPDNGYNSGDKELDVYNDRFIADQNWFLPIPTSAKNLLKTDVEDLYDQVINGTYPY